MVYLFALTSLAWGVGCRPAAGRNQAESKAEAGKLLVLSPAKIDLGRIPRGGRRDATFRVENRGVASVELSAVTTTCDCLSVTTPRGTIAPGEKVEATVCADFTNDPDFSGSLSMEATARVKGSNVVAFTLGVDVKVE